MIRRVASIGALLVATCVVFLATPQLSAVGVQRELIARSFGTQTLGPVQFASATGGGVPWGLDRLDARSGKDGSYTYSTDGTGVTVYIVDSGINDSHPEFSGRVLPGWSYRADSTARLSYLAQLTYELSHPGEGIAVCPYKTNNTYNPSGFDNTSTPIETLPGAPDNDGHGTHVAGTIGGIYSGVAKAVSFVPVRVLDSCGLGTVTMVRKGLEWILANHLDGQRAVVNMSIGFDSSATSIDTAITNLMAEGIVIVAASGNSGASACGTTPAGTPGTISVGAINAEDNEPSWSNYGQCVDIFAPGDSVLSAWPKNGAQLSTYFTESGTSMAAPHVSGAIARYLQTATVTSATPLEAWSWLKQNATCNAVRTVSSNINGSARLEAERTANRLLAVDAPGQGPCAPTSVTATVASKSTVVSWAVPIEGNGSPVSGYTATAGPDGLSCTTVALTCEITGLVNGQTYSVTVAASNVTGAGTSSTPVSVLPDGIPDIPVSALSTVGNKMVTVSWPLVTTTSSAMLKYIVTATPGGATCTTQTTSCIFDGLENGTSYTFAVSTSTVSGFYAVTSTVVTARPGFEVKKTVVAKKSRSALSWIVTTQSKGKKTWSESGPCSITGSRLVAPTKKATCVLILKVAKSKSYPSMSTKVKIEVG